MKGRLLWLPEDRVCVILGFRLTLFGSSCLGQLLPFGSGDLESSALEGIYGLRTWGLIR